MLNDLDEMAKSSQLNLLLNGGDSAKSAQVHAISLAVFTSFPRKTMTHGLTLLTESKVTKDFPKGSYQFALGWRESLC